MNVTNIRAEVFHGRFRGFSANAERVMEIPQRRQIVGNKRLKQRAQLGGVGIDANRFNQQNDVRVLRLRQDLFQKRNDFRLVAGNRLEANKLRLEPFCRFNAQRQFLLRRLSVYGNVRNEVNAGNFQTVFQHPAVNGRQPPGLRRVEQRLDVVNFNPVELVFDSNIDELVDIVFIPSVSGKGQFHSFSSSS